MDSREGVVKLKYRYPDGGYSLDRMRLCVREDLYVSRMPMTGYENTIEITRCVKFEMRDGAR